MAWKWYDSKVIKIEDASSTTKRFWVKVETEEVFDFRAGQFVTMDLPISDKRLKRWRSYSIANEPDHSNILEFCVVYLENGPASEYLFKEIEIGSTIRFKGPSGNFCLPEKIDKDLVFICTGTGVAPFRGMLLDIKKNNKPQKKIHLIFGTRFKEGILYREEFESFAKENPNFKYSIALSREEDWNGHKGYIHDIYLNDYKEVKDDIDFYLCGWTKMIDESVENLIIKMGYKNHQIHYELYG
jgi:CDP-4-dehydro-6-deoxyglucose reductase